MKFNHTQNFADFFNFKKEDRVLYLGGRIDDDNLYPEKYCNYLNLKIKELSPTVIICQGYVYAKKYYDKKILDQDMIIDIIIVNCQFILIPSTNNNMMTKTSKNQRDIILELKRKNENMKFLLYHSEFINIAIEKSVIERYQFGNHNLRYYSQKKNIKWRKILPKEPLDITKKNYETISNQNSTDGFWWNCFIINNFHEKYGNLNIIGFSAFEEMDEDKYLSKYQYGRFKNQNFNTIKTSENTNLERERRNIWCKNNIINNLENKEELMKYIQPI